ncbi:MAG: adenylate kinase [Chlamydiae bacterium]|nr:adenylate kinase [Chlamydiota bacterium]MBI3276994.1 adenylate kinase [Chlamydiota bacterium]
MKKRIVLLGPPGAGKGTQARDLVKALNVPHISTGDILREALGRGTPIGLQAKSYMNQGELVPDEVMAKIILERLEEKDAGKGFILDGYPRTVPQAILLEKGLKIISIDIDTVIEVTANEDLIVSRLAFRRVCKKCGATYHLKNIPSKVLGVCDLCGGELVQRKDDEEKTVRRRLEVYREQSKPLVDYYRGKGMLKTVDGGLEREKTYAELLESVGLSSSARVK